MALTVGGREGALLQMSASESGSPPSRLVPVSMWESGLQQATTGWGWGGVWQEAISPKESDATQGLRSSESSGLKKAWGVYTVAQGTDGS